MAGLAAAQRKTAEEQEIEDACPSGRGTGVGEGVVVHARPRDAASPVVEVGWRASEVVEVTVDEEEGSSMEVVEVGHGDGDGDGEGHSPASCRGGRHEEHEPAPVAAAPPLETPATVPSSAAMPPPSTAVPPPPLDAASSPPARAPAPAPAAMPEAAASVDEGAVEQLLDLGFARAAIVAALGRAGGDVERAVNLLVAAGGVVEAAPAAPGVVEGEDEEVPLDLTTREGRAVAAARRLVREETRGDEPGRVAALSTLKLMLQAVLVRRRGCFLNVDMDGRTVIHPTYSSTTTPPQPKPNHRTTLARPSTGACGSATPNSSGRWDGSPRRSCCSARSGSRSG